MTSWQRWLIVAMCTAIAIGVPLAIRERPADSSSLSAEELLDAAIASRQTPYTGYVEALGTLQLPVAENLEELGPLFGERSRLRVWWRSPDLWRVDQIGPSGETDYFHRGTHTNTWTYEEFHTTRLRDRGVRLPLSPDLTPPQLAYYLMGGAREDALTTLPSDRIAGRSAPGFRITPTDERSSIVHVDIWVDADSGVPLRVSVFDAAGIAFTSAFLDFEQTRPSDAIFRFPSPRGSSTSSRDAVDLADAANRFAPFEAPEIVAGFERSDNRRLDAVGVYGEGLTRFVVIPLDSDAATPIRDQFLVTPTADLTPDGPVLSVGPLAVAITRWDEAFAGGGWLVAGTVTPEALTEIVAELDEPKLRGLRGIDG